eukprot:4795842-Pyramimonas_sp.AAC.1
MNHIGEALAETAKRPQRDLGEYFNGAWHQWATKNPTRSGRICADPARQDPESCVRFLEEWTSH